jgi:hypothetical protein
MYISIIMVGYYENYGNTMHDVLFPREIFFILNNNLFKIKMDYNIYYKYII